MVHLVDYFSSLVHNDHIHLDYHWLYFPVQLFLEECLWLVLFSHGTLCFSYGMSWLYHCTHFQVPVSFLISAFVKKASNSTSVGFLVFILGFFVQLAAGVIYSDLTDDWLRNLFSLFPPSTFTVGLYYLGDATEKDTDGGVR